MRILLIEDDAMIGKAVRVGLAQAGFTVDWVTDGRSAELALAKGVYDLAVLDLGLPKKDGMAILASLRALGNSMPVLIASARDTVRDRIAASADAGARSIRCEFANSPTARALHRAPRVCARRGCDTAA